MDALLVKIFATALTLSQVTTAPDQVKTQFDRVQDQAQVVQLLQAGCAHMRKAFDIEDLNLDDLIATAMEDPQGMTGGSRGLSRHQFQRPVHRLQAVLQERDRREAGRRPRRRSSISTTRRSPICPIPPSSRARSCRAPRVVLDGKGARFAELFESDQRRVWVALSDIPKPVQQAFVSAEDKRFYQHNGIDERSLIRAFIGNIAQSGRPQGGSTITQQVVKNLLVGEDLTYERKIREMILTARVERLLSKAEILELYLNSTYLGRGSWGVEMAARSYFGKSVKALTLGEGALLAALTKGPTYFSPDQHPDRAQERIAYVLGRMQEDGAISAAELKQASNPMPTLVAYVNPRRDIGFHFVDNLAREAKAVAGIDALTVQFLHGALDHPAGPAARHRSRPAGGARPLRDRWRPRFVPRRRGQSGQRHQAHPAGSESRAAEAGVAAGARAGAPAALRCALAGGGGGRQGRRQGRRHDPGRARRRPHPAACGRVRLHRAHAQAL